MGIGFNYLNRREKERYCYMETTHYGENYIGNVIRIMDNRTLLVNAGSSLLQVGDTVQVYELCNSSMRVPLINLSELATCKKVFL